MFRRTNILVTAAKMRGKRIILCFILSAVTLALVLVSRRMYDILLVNYEFKNDGVNIACSTKGTKKASHRIEGADINLLEPEIFTSGRSYVVVKQRKYSSLSGKRFVYLISGPTKGVVEGLEETKERDVIWLTFADMSGDIYAPNTSIFAGRNALLQHAVNLAVQMLDGGYEYYIFMDDDVILSVRSDGDVNWKPWSEMSQDPFRRFEEFLMYYQPAVGYVRYKDMRRQLVNTNKPVNLHWDFDECFNAFHRDTLSFLLPYDLHLDYESWFYPAWTAKQLMAILYHSYRFQCNSLRVFNPISGRNVSKERYKQYFDYRKPRDYVWSALLSKTNSNPSAAIPFLEAILKGQSALDNPGDLQPGPTISMPGQPKRKGNHSYIVTPDFIYQYWDANHPMIKKKLIWREKPEIRKLLRLGIRRPQPFVPDTVYSLAVNNFTLLVV